MPTQIITQNTYFLIQDWNVNVSNIKFFLTFLLTCMYIRWGFFTYMYVHGVQSNSTILNF